MKEIFIVTAVDVGENCDGKARVLGLFKSQDEADKYVCADIKEYVQNRDIPEDLVDYVQMFAYWDDDYTHGCEWNIEKVSLPEFLKI